MSDANLLLEKDAAVATITFNNPKALNALTEETFTGMESLLDELEKDAEIRVIILTGAGDKAFIAGGDISHLASLDAEGARQFALLAQRVIDRIETFPKPVIAAVNGYCLGGGNELAMGCDLRIAADSAKFGQPEVKLGIIPGFAGTQRLSRLVGKGRAKEMIYTGEMIDAAEAYRIGLVGRRDRSRVGDVGPTGARIDGRRQGQRSRCSVDDIAHRPHPGTRDIRTLARGVRYIGHTRRQKVGDRNAGGIVRAGIGYGDRVGDGTTGSIGRHAVGLRNGQVGGQRRRVGVGGALVAGIRVADRCRDRGGVRMARPGTHDGRSPGGTRRGVDPGDWPRGCSRTSRSVASGCASARANRGSSRWESSSPCSWSCPPACSWPGC